MKRWMLTAAVAAACCAGAETRAWLANVDGNWATAGMWSGGVVPGDGDTVDFSILTGDKTVTLPAAGVKVAQLVYNPTIGSETNKITLAGGGISIKTSVTVGEMARLETTCDVKATADFYIYGLGEWRIAKSLVSDTGAGRKLYQRAGRLTVASAATMNNIWFYPATLDGTLPAAEFVMEDGATVNFQSLGDFELAQADESRAVFTMNGGTLLPRNSTSAGCFLNALGTRSHSVVNIHGGLVDGTGKNLWPSFKGTGVVNQTAGTMMWKNIIANNTDTGHATYNLTGGELWLQENFSRNGRPAYMNVGDAKLVKTGTGFLDVTNSIARRFEIEVTDAAYTCEISTEMSGAGGLVKTGPGVLNFYRDEKKFTGPFIVSNGTVRADANMPGGNAVTVAGGTLKLCHNRPYTFSSLTLCGTGTLLTTNTATVKLPAAANVVTIADDAVLAMDEGRNCLSPSPRLVITDNGKVRIPTGTVHWFPAVQTGTDALPDGVYTKATAGFIDGDGTMVVGNRVWSGAAGDGLWSAAANWQGGSRPFDSAGGVDLSAAAGTLTMDGTVTASALVYAPAAGGVLMNKSDAVLTLAEGAVITVGAGSTLVLNGDVCLQNNNFFKRGAGTLVFAKAVTAGTVAAAPVVSLYVQEGRCRVEGAASDVAFYAGLWGQSALTEAPEVEFGPDSSLSGVSYLAGVGNNTNVDPLPGDGLFTQQGGTIRPSSGWSTAASLAVTPDARQTAATGTYHLVDGVFEVPSGKVLSLGNAPAYGVFRQDGGESRIAQLAWGTGGATGEVDLQDGLMAIGAFGRAGTHLKFTGGTFRPLNAALTVPTAWSLLGNTTFHTPDDTALTFTAASGGTGALVKTGAGTLTLAGGAENSNDVSVVAGTLAVGTGGAFGTLALAEGTTLNLTGVSTATNFTLAGVAQPAGGAVYSAANCTFITGGGSLLVGATPGKWNGAAGDGKWSTAGNWSGNIIPNGAAMDVDLSAAASGATLTFDAGAFTVGSLVYATGTGEGTLTNAAPDGGTDNVLNLAANGVITVGEGETLVLDHPLCMLGEDAYKRGRGTLVLRQGMHATAARATAANYFNIEEGTVINEGAVQNVCPIPGAKDRTDPAHVPQFINRGDDATVSGSTFVCAMHMRAASSGTAVTAPGNGVFTQDGGTVAPQIGWQVQGSIGYAPANAAVGCTGTYHLVRGTLRIPAGKVLNMHNNNGFGVFTQDDGLFENNGTFDMYNGLVTLNGGRMRLNAVASAQPITFAGGTFSPLPVHFTFNSSFALTGDGAFEIETGKTMTLAAANPLTGSAPLVKTGGGVLAITGSGATWDGAVRVNAGTLRLTGALPASTNIAVAADAVLEVATGTAAFNDQTVLRVARDGKVNLTGTGAVAVDALWVNDVPRKGRGRRYGSSRHAGDVDVVDDRYFEGTGVLVVTGPSDGEGTTILFR